MCQTKKKRSWKCDLQNCSHFVQVSVCKRWTIWFTWLDNTRLFTVLCSCTATSVTIFMYMPNICAHASVVCGACHPAVHFIALTGSHCRMYGSQNRSGLFWILEDTAHKMAEYIPIPVVRFWLVLFCWLSRDLGGREIDFHSYPEHDRRIKKMWQTLNNG